MTIQLDSAPRLPQRRTLPFQQTLQNVNTSLVQQRSSLRIKAIALAIALGTVPMLGIGVTTLLLANQPSPTNHPTRATEETDQAYRQLLLNLAIGTGAAALLVGAIAAYLASFTTRPLLDALEAEAERTQILRDITLSIRSSLKLEDVFKTTVREVRTALKTDRVLIFRLDPTTWEGTVIAESVGAGWPQILGTKIDDPCFRERHVEMYQKGQVTATSNIYERPNPVGASCYIKMLEPFGVKANLVAPILKENQLMGLMIAHQCSGSRDWQQWEVEFFTQLATQVGFALDQASLLEQQQIKGELERLFTSITLRIRQSLSLEDIFNTTVKEIRTYLKADRVLIFRLDPTTWDGTVVAESVGAGWPQILGAVIDDPCFKERHVAQYRNGRVTAANDIYKETHLTNPECYHKMLEPFEVRANLVAPILRDKQLLGLVIAHQCSGPREWQQFEIDLFTQLATQVGFAIDQASLLEQVEQSRQEAEIISHEQRQQKEALQLQLIELLSDVEGASKGDLTVRADVTVGEIGTVADFFNAIIENLRQIVIQVKSTAVQVGTSLGDSEGAVRQLAEEALAQAGEISRTLDSVEQMTLSIQEVASSARQAAEVARNASATAEIGGAAMDRTVQSILGLRETVAETAKKVKRLGESSQKISKIVSLINQIALQTNVLAINASIEAARAGEEGRGFAVVAEEVGQLAAQSSQATKEIEQVVENIQLETSEVVRAMELGTTQVVEGTHLVEDAKQSLEKILEVSRQIDQLVQSISTATVSQAQTSQGVASLMKDIARVSENTSGASRQVSSSLQQTVEVARRLQASVDVFRVGAHSELT